MIMNRAKGSRVFLSILLATISATSVQAAAVLAGSATTGNGDSFSVFGEGFSMTGFSGHYYAAGACRLQSCTAPGTYSFFDFISSAANVGVYGAYTLDGFGAPYVCNQTTICGAGIEFSGSFTLPDFGETPPLLLTITTPFLSDGGINGLMTSPGVYAPDLLFQGGGIATIDLQRLGRAPVYTFAGATYYFVATPEPSAIALVGLGLVALIGARRAMVCKRGSVRPSA